MLKSVRKLTYSIAIILLTSLLVLYGIFKKKKPFPTSLIFSLSPNQVFDGKSPENLVASFREERFRLFFNSERPLIQVRSFRLFKTSDSRFTFDITQRLITSHLKRVHYKALVKGVLNSFLNVSNGAELSLSQIKELTLDASLCALLSSKLDVKFDLITTQSTLTKLPFYFENLSKANRIMVWYSSNNKPMTFVGEQDYINWNPKYVDFFIDKHLVWDKDDVKFLATFGIVKVSAVGSIVLQPKVLAEKRNDTFVISYYDITPVAPKYNYLMGNHENFYSELDAIGDLMQFSEYVKDLTNKFGRTVKVRIKPKRPYSRVHSTKYIKYLSGITKELGIEVLEPNKNLYEVISESDLIIATPWTSPAIIAKEVFSNSVFFCSRKEGWNIPPEYRGVKVLKSSSQLLEFSTLKILDKFSD